jgi:hypothetical protein
VSDDPGIQSQAVTSSETTTAEPKAGMKGFLSTTVGKVVAGCLGAAILLAIIGVVVFFALASFGVSVLGQAGNQATPGTGSTLVVPSGGGAGAGGSKPATSVVPSVVATPNVLTVTDDEVFTPRDPFIPVILPSPEPISASGTAASGDNLVNGSTSGSITTPDSSALYLRMIVSGENGSAAVLDYKGTIYVALAGAEIPNSPWKVVSVGTKSVVMLFGDERVTIALGEGISGK